MKAIYEQGIDTTELFRIEAASDDGFLAVRDANPRFALWGKTSLEAYSAAIRALASVDRSPEGGDRETGRHAKHESAVGEAETPTTEGDS